ncbi:hypothetical protein MtrunA17_Chr8g0347401 [Medicago truncatula]|uniref:Uncharacterized protein n=1 Tax=Medicago truncatula TaxID=3880 RepID=A0A396GEH5_MEDTR|nr:hypothetical protein MtrunA17_Chr8g0347401 [Medicago truncatula]
MHFLPKSSSVFPSEHSQHPVLDSQILLSPFPSQTFQLFPSSSHLLQPYKVNQ